MKLQDVSEAKALDGHRIWLRFDDGTQGEVLLSSLVSFDGVFAELSDPVKFAELRVDAELGTVCWPNGADLDPVVLYCQVAGLPLPGAVDPSS